MSALQTLVVDDSASARTVLKRLLERPGIDYYQRARVEARVEELKPYMAELERQRIRKEDQDA